MYYLHSSKNRPCFSLEPRNCGDILLKETNYQSSAVQPDRIYQIYFLLPVTHISLFANIILRSDPNPITSETLPHILDHKIANCQKRPKIELLWPV